MFQFSYFPIFQSWREVVAAANLRYCVIQETEIFSIWKYTLWEKYLEFKIGWVSVFTVINELLSDLVQFNYDLSE